MHEVISAFQHFSFLKDEMISARPISAFQPFSFSAF